MRRFFVLFPLAAIAAIAAGCSASDASNDGSSESQIKGAGTTGATYPEAVLIDATNKNDTKDTWKCSGTVIAPKVILTSGICAGSHTSWTISAPYANKQTAVSTSAAAYKWSFNLKGHTDIKAHNVGLIFLTNPITLPSYPVLTRRPMASGDKVIALGRTNNKKVSDTDLFPSAPITLRVSNATDFPFDYTSAHVVDPGDSGGAQELLGSTPHQIVAVTSKILTSVDTFSRLDPQDVSDWITQQVMANGGFAQTPDAGVDSGNSGDAGDAGMSVDGASIDGSFPDAMTPPLPPYPYSDGGTDPDADVDDTGDDTDAGAPGRCSTDVDCNMGQIETNWVCGDTGTTDGWCIKGCHADLDCPGIELCDTTLESWDCR